MHEYGLAEGVLATVRQRAAGRKVAAIRVRFGVKHAVDEESMAQAWGFVAEETEAEGSAVALVTVPATLTCQDCGLTAETTDVLAVCPGCRGENVEITGGDEMTLESITYEPARTGREGIGMCLGIPAQLVAGETGHPDLVMAEVGGVPRTVNVGLLDERPGPGDWILVHMGFALNVMTPEEAADALDALGAERAAEDREAATVQAAMDAAAQAEEEAIAARWMS